MERVHVFDPQGSLPCERSDARTANGRAMYGSSSLVGVRTARRLREFGPLFSRLFALGLVLFMMQPWSPRVSIFPLQVLLIWVLFSWAALFRGAALKHTLGIFSTTQWLIVLTLAGAIFVRSVLDGANIERFGQLATGVAIALLGAVVFQSERGRRILLTGLSLGATLSCCIAMLQYFNFAPWVWQATKYAHVGYIYGSTGLENNPVAFSYSVIGAGVVLVSSWLLRWRAGIRTVSTPSGLAFFSGFAIIAGLVVSNSRSGLLGLTLGIIVVTVWGRIPRASHKPLPDSNPTFGPAVALHTLFFGLMALMLLIGLTMYAVRVRESSVLADVRFLKTWQAYLPVIWRNPLGLPGDADMMLAMREAGTLAHASALAKTGGGVIDPHNFLLTTGIAYGPVAAVALCLLYSSALRDARRSFISLRRSGRARQALWVVLLTAANVAILGHSWFHNASIAMGEMRNWLWLGLLGAMVRQGAGNRVRTPHDKGSRHGRLSSHQERPSHYNG